MPPPDAQTLPRSTFAAAVGVALVAGALRLWQAGESLWLDELHTAWCATGDLADVAARAAIGNQSPLFFWLEWILTRILGPSEVALRLPSLAAGSLLPLAVFGLAWRCTRSSGVSLTAAALVALDRTLIFYATEARPYALVQLLAVIHVAVTFELIDRPRPRIRVAWIGLAALMFHLHYTAALLVLAELVFWGSMLMARTGTTKYRLSMVVVDMAAVAVLCLPALGNLRAIFARRENWAAFVQPESFWMLAKWFPWTLSAPLAIAGAMATTRHRRIVCLAVGWLLAPAIIAWIATATDVARLFFPRYLIASAPAAILLAGICTDYAPWRWSKIALGVLLVVACLWNSGIVEQVREDGRVIGDRNEDWRGAMQWLNERLPEQPYPVLVASGLIEADELRQPHERLLEDYCLFPVTSLYPLATDRANLIPLAFREPWRLDPDVRQIVGQRGGAWLVVRGSRRAAERIVEGSGTQRVPGVQGSEGKLETNLKSFGNVQITLLTSEF